jgi:hypothetical protein
MSNVTAVLFGGYLADETVQYTANVQVRSTHTPLSKTCKLFALQHGFIKKKYAQFYF